VSDLAGHVQDYLKMRRALGFKLKRPGEVLPQLVAYLEAAGARTLTAELAICWARLPQGVQPVNWAQRLGAARGFAVYLKTIDPSTEIPPQGVFPARQHRPSPYLWSQTEVCRLLAAARRLGPPLRATTYEALFGLIAVCGLRLGEAIGLTRDDIDLTDGILTIRDGKFGRWRLVPLHPTATDALRSYADCRDRLCPQPAAATFFLSTVGTALRATNVHRTFNQLTTATGLRTTTVRPRIHDLRHSFAVHTLLDWHRSEQDIAGRIPVLSTYLGHVNPAGTYWYLSAAPELMQLAAARLHSRGGAGR
jgi:integrase